MEGYLLVYPCRHFRDTPSVNTAVSVVHTRIATFPMLCLFTYRERCKIRMIVIYKKKGNDYVK